MSTLPSARPVATAGALAAALSVALPAAAEPPYDNGGIGQQEVQAIESHEGAYNVHMVFSQGPHNVYVANVGLRIDDRQGRTVLSLPGAGPLTNVQLPPGRYTVSARYHGHEQRHDIDVKAGTPVDLFLHYPAAQTGGTASAGL